MAYDDSEARDEHGRWTSGGPSFMGAHDKLDRLASNAHAKINASAPPTYGIMRAGKKTYVIASGKNGTGDYVSSHTTMRAAKMDAASRQRSHQQNHEWNMETRGIRAERAGNYLRTRAGRDAKYGKQLKFKF
jgi:hypothetical protein